tara:strand:- start:10355 stop:11638 length:1284 start_codon:yes stop_codon:yes gene_type:complete
MKIYNFINTLLLLLLVSNFTSYSQNNESILNNNIVDKNIHTALLHKINDPLSYPIIKLNSEEKLILSFDDFNRDLRDYYYTIIHCNSDWAPSDLMQSEYIDGFFENRIEDYEFSFNTLQKYTNYQLVFPEEYLQPILSGNYIISVFTNNNPDEVVLQKRFMILDEKISVSAQVKRSTIIDERLYKQEVDFNINHGNMYISNPYTDIKVVVKQNNREDNAIYNLKPLFIKKDHLVYDYEQINTFEAGNEYRYFDIKSIRYQSEKIKDITIDSNNINVKLFTDVSRSFNEFISLSDINGNFLINKQEAWNSETESDYVNVQFSLLENRKISYGDIYLIGRFTDWIIKDEYKLIWNEINRKYECNTLLKQGYYNYLYILKEKSNNETNLSFIEGSHYQCKNEYYIYVYFRDIGKTYDQFIGYLKTSSELF